jgi:hypothetical protein
MLRLCWAYLARAPWRRLEHEHFLVAVPGTTHALATFNARCDELATRLDDPLLSDRRRYSRRPQSQRQLSRRHRRARLAIEPQGHAHENTPAIHGLKPKIDAVSTPQKVGFAWPRLDR